MLKNKGVRCLALALSGALAALPVCFSAISLAVFFSFIPMLYLLFSEFLDEGARFRPSHYYGVGLLVLIPYFIVAFHWFAYLYPLDFVDSMTPVAALAIVALACVGLPFLQALGFAFLFWILARIARRGTVRRYPILLPFLFAAFWSLFAFTQTLTWAGVPWGAQLALALYEVPFLLAPASLFGSYFVTFLIAAVNACIAYALLMLKQGKKHCVRRGAFAALCLVFVHLSLSLIGYCMPVSVGESVKVAVLQGNVPSTEKWDASTDCIGIYGDLAREAAKDGAKIMVWPETAVPTYLMTYPNINRVKGIAKETSAIQIVGTYAFDGKSGSAVRYNAFYLIYPDGTVDESIYYKRHLVPFGEYVPLEDFVRAVLPQLAEIEMLADGSIITPGKNPELFDTEYGKIGSLICFDTIYESLCRDSVAAGAELIAIGTNDSWFFDSAAVYMHNGQAVLRAVENGRYVMRAANTGISSVIDPHGNILTEIEPLVAGQASADVSFVTSRTLYSYIGDVFLILCQIFVLIPVAVSLLPWLKKLLAALDK